MFTGWDKWIFWLWAYSAWTPSFYLSHFVGLTRCACDWKVILSHLWTAFSVQCNICKPVLGGGHLRQREIPLCGWSVCMSGFHIFSRNMASILYHVSYRLIYVLYERQRISSSFSAVKKLNQQKCSRQLRSIFKSSPQASEFGRLDFTLQQIYHKTGNNIKILLRKVQTSYQLNAW